MKFYFRIFPFTESGSSTGMEALFYMEDYFNCYRAQLKEALDSLDGSVLNAVYHAMEKARQTGKQIFVLGNGGSAAAASHWVCDFGKGINTQASRRMRIYSLADSMSLETAIGNDFSYDDVFLEPLKNYLNPGDLIISLSVSGNSRNLIRAHEYARTIGAYTAAIIGDYDGKLASCSDLVLTIASRNYGVVEDIHLTIDHAISQYMKKQNEQTAV